MSPLTLWEGLEDKGRSMEWKRCHAPALRKELRCENISFLHILGVCCGKL